jgi:hypothetical protein
MIMATVIFEYNENDRTASSMFGAIAAIPGIRAFFDANVIVEQWEKTATKKMNIEEFSCLPLSEQAKLLNQSINKEVPTMTMEEIVQEVRDYRNEK